MTSIVRELVCLSYVGRSALLYSMILYRSLIKEQWVVVQLAGSPLRDCSQGLVSAGDLRVTEGGLSVVS